MGSRGPPSTKGDGSASLTSSRPCGHPGIESPRRAGRAATTGARPYQPAGRGTPARNGHSSGARPAGGSVSRTHHPRRHRSVRGPVLRRQQFHLPRCTSRSPPSAPARRRAAPSGPRRPHGSRRSSRRPHGSRRSSRRSRAAPRPQPAPDHPAPPRTGAGGEQSARTGGARRPPGGPGSSHAGPPCCGFRLTASRSGDRRLRRPQSRGSTTPNPHLHVGTGPISDAPHAMAQSVGWSCRRPPGLAHSGVHVHDVASPEGRPPAGSEGRQG